MRRFFPPLMLSMLLHGAVLISLALWGVVAWRGEEMGFNSHQKPLSVRLVPPKKTHDIAPETSVPEVQQVMKPLVTPAPVVETVPAKKEEALPEEEPSPPASEHDTVEAPETAFAADALVWQEGYMSVSLLTEDYQHKLMRHLERYKHYPLSARRAHVTGTVYLGFTLNEKGRFVNGVTVVKSSGSAVLDNAAVGALTKAEPMPKPDTGHQVPFLLPVHFGLR